GPSSLPVRISSCVFERLSSCR
ncbi:MAG: hypothetical protein AVDCRST_MAG93-6758, partial [uncultured Chloroflexia bacterium]